MIGPGLDPKALRAQIWTTLSALTLYSANAEELLMATCAQESQLGRFRHQVDGPAIGIFQMDPDDFSDIWGNYLAYHAPLADAIRALASTQPPRPIELQNNDPFAIAMCRVQYLRAPGALPAAADLAALWAYYKQYYNTPDGAATEGEFYENYYRYVKGPAL